MPEETYENNSVPANEPPVATVAAVLTGDAPIGNLNPAMQDKPATIEFTNETAQELTHDEKMFAETAMFHVRKIVSDELEKIHAICHHDLKALFSVPGRTTHYAYDEVKKLFDAAKAKREGVEPKA